MKHPDKLILILFIAFFLAIKLPFVYYKFSDENVYFYMGKMIAEGLMPYRDFFYANPPFHIYFISLLVKVFDSNIFALKLFPILESILISVMLFLILRKAGKWQALAASLLYLFSFAIITTSDYSTGVHLTSLLLVISVYLISNEKYHHAGLFAALSVLTKQYAAPAAIGLLIYLFLARRKKFFDFLVPFIIVSAITHLAFFILAGQAYPNEIFFYHLLKPEGIEKSRIVEFFVYWDFPALFFVLLSFLFGKKENMMLPLSILLPTLISYILFSDIYYLYFALAMPYLAWIGGHGLWSLVSKIPKSRYFLFSAILLISAYHSYFYVADHGPAARIDFAQDLSDFVKMTTLGNETIYGSAEITPLISILSEREITNHYADTNRKLFMTGTISTARRTEEIKGKARYIISKAVVSEGRIIINEDFVDKKYLSECRIAKTYDAKKDYFSNAVIVFDCRK
ncbi:MAG: glycosyltransferase family 39 protein [Candidatus Aenigmarchaeota archaeon]|nr:glycosyltransferase family 39 protein [Candidatus Aenigmarchaeota archaeon]